VAWKDDPLRAALRAVYDEVDTLLAPFSCEGTAECCDSAITGREPLPTAIELEEVALGVQQAGLARSAGPGSGRPRNANKRHLPVAGRCPLLSADDRCRVYASRPFGCRTFFCHRAEGPGKLPRAELLRLGREVAALSARFAPVDPHPRPLARALARRLGL